MLLKMLSGLQDIYIYILKNIYILLNLAMNRLLVCAKC